MSYADTTLCTTGGIPFSRFFGRVHPKLDVPIESLGLTVFVVVIFGCIFLGSTSAFNAITAASVVALGLSYGIPVAINCLRGRKMLPPTRAFILPEWFAWFANILGIVYTILTTVLFVFPPDLPVTGSSMNYCIVAFGIVTLISIFQWFIDGRKNYTGPTMELDETVLTATESPANARGPGAVESALGEKGNESNSDRQFGATDLSEKDV
jgi:choline transport protein